MLSFQEFFDACSGVWQTERIYHYLPGGEIERSYTEFRVHLLAMTDKQNMLAPFDGTLGEAANIKGDLAIAPGTLADNSEGCPGFAIAFHTRSETGEEVSMSLKALFVPDRYITVPPKTVQAMPLAANVVVDQELIQGFYLRDEGYSEAGAIAGRFTYQPTRQILEMTTYYRRSVAVDQMRMVSPEMRLRTIVTYQRPETNDPPSVISLVGFGVEQKQVD